MPKYLLQETLCWQVFEQNFYSDKVEMYYELHTMLQIAICTIAKETFYKFGLQGKTAIRSIDQGACKW